MTTDEREAIAEDLEHWRRHGAAVRCDDDSMTDLRPLDLALAFADLAARLAGADASLRGVKLGAAVTINLAGWTDAADREHLQAVDVLGAGVLPGMRAVSDSMGVGWLCYQVAGVTPAGLPVQILDVVESGAAEVRDATPVGHLRSSQWQGEALVVGCSCGEFRMGVPDEATADRAWTIHTSRAVNGDDGRHEAGS